MPSDGLELAPLDVSRLHWQPFGGSFQGLDTGHLVDRNGLTALFGHGGRRFVHREMSAHFSSKPGSGFGVSQ